MGLNEQLTEISNQLKEIKQEKEGKKPKNFKLPFGKKVGNGQAKRNYVTLIKINDNGVVTFDKKQIEEQTTIIDGVPRLATTDHVLFYKKNPIIIQPSWSVEPISPKQHLQNSLENGSNIAGYQLLLNRMKLSAVGEKKKMGGWVAWVFGIIILGIIAYAFFSGKV